MQISLPRKIAIYFLLGAVALLWQGERPREGGWTNLIKTLAAQLNRASFNKVQT